MIELTRVEIASYYSVRAPNLPQSNRDRWTPESTMLALLGHMSRAMLEHYSHVRLAAKRVAVEALTTRVGGAVLEPTATNSTTVVEVDRVQ